MRFGLDRFSRRLAFTLGPGMDGRDAGGPFELCRHAEGRRQYRQRALGVPGRQGRHGRLRDRPDEEVGKRLGDDVSFVNIPFTGLFAAVQSGQIDAAVSSITITKKRLASVSFAQPYYDSDQSLTVLAKSGITGPQGHGGKIVGVDTGSTGDIYATAHQAEDKFADIRRYEGLSPAMLDLAAGRIDGYVSDIPALQYYVKDKPAYKVVQRILTGEQYSIMFAKDSPLVGKVDASADHAEAGRLHRQAAREVVRRAGRGDAPAPS